MIGPKLNFAKSIIASNFKRLTFPLKCSLAVTYRCNMSCKMCSIWKKPSDRQELTVGEVENFFRKAGRFSWVGLTGGEPFFRGDIEDVVRVIIKQSAYLYALHFGTNGSFTDRIIKLAENIRKKHKRLKLVFTVSIDGPPGLHNEIRGVHGIWDKAVETFVRLKQMPDVKAQIGFTISPYNMGRFREAFDAIRRAYPKLRFDDININVFQKSDFFYDNQGMQGIDETELFSQIKDIMAMDKEGFSINNFLRRVYLKFYLEYRKQGKTPLKCQALSSSLFIDPYGDLFPCVVFNKKLINIKEMGHDLSLVWRRDATRRISRECVYNNCPVCWSPCDAFSSIGGSLLKSVRKYVQDNMPKYS